MKEKQHEKMVGARLSKEYRNNLAEILRRTKRTFRGQLEMWIETEKRILDRG